MRLKFCAVCGNTEDIEQHHWTPKSLDGPDEEANLLTLCSKHHGEIHSMKRRCNISKITKERLAAAKARGVKLGSYGKIQAQENKRKANKFAEKMKPIIEELNQDGFTSFNAVAQELNDRGIKTARGGNNWHPSSVRNLIMRIENPIADSPQGVRNRSLAEWKKERNQKN